MWANTSKIRGFTITELIIVIVVVAILSSVVIVGYGGVQRNARDVQRKSDIATIASALEMYYLKNGQYPAGSGSTVINASWSTTADASWENLQALLEPYITKLPIDPTNTPGVSPMSATGYNYAYFANASTYCASGVRQMYILVYRFEATAQANTLRGDCPSNPLLYAGASNYRVAR